MIMISMESAEFVINTFCLLILVWFGVFLLSLFIMATPADPNNKPAKLCVILATLVTVVVFLFRVGFFVLVP